MASTIVQRRTELARGLSRSLSGEFVVVPGPDHPLVMRSVDLLVGGRSGLTAVMMSTAEELRQPKLFEARLTLNMMALPPHTVFVRIAAGDERSSSYPSAFVAELNLEDRDARSDLTKIVSAPPLTRRIEQAEKAQMRSEGRFAGTYRLARVLRRGSENDRRAYDQRVSRAPSRDRISNDIEAAFFEQAPSLSAVSHLTMLEADRWYGIMEGEVEPKHSAASVVFVPAYPEVRGDPDKAVRAAAFAGWVMLPSHTTRSLDDVGELIQKYTRLL